MKHLKIIEKGFTELTGFIGSVEFVDGISLNPLSIDEAGRICSAMRAEFVDGSNASPAGVLVAERERRAEVVDKLMPEKEFKPTKVDLYIIAKAEDAKAKQAPKYSREDLETLADEKGINGLREVAQKFGVKSNSVAKIIDGILAKQG